jgi:ribosomal protein S18 acetylase RimI-like enzyme
MVRGLLANEVERGFSAWIVDDDAGELAVVGAHVGRPHPLDHERTITYIGLLAARSDRRGQPDGRGLTQVLRAMFQDILLTVERAPYVYQMVAVENLRMRAFLERSGFQATSVPSDDRYLYYSARVDAPAREIDRTLLVGSDLGAVTLD